MRHHSRVMLYYLIGFGPVIVIIEVLYIFSL